MRVVLISLSCLVAAEMFGPATQAHDGYIVLAEHEPQTVVVDTVAQQVSRITSRPVSDSAPSLPECNRTASVDWRDADHAAVAVECPQQWRVLVWVTNPRRPVKEDCTAATWRACLSKPGDSRQFGVELTRHAALAAAIIDANPR
jgi:hypothetical protein